MVHDTGHVRTYVLRTYVQYTCTTYVRTHVQYTRVRTHAQNTRTVLGRVHTQARRVRTSARTTAWEEWAKANGRSLPFHSELASRAAVMAR